MSTKLSVIMEEADLFFYPPNTVGSDTEGYFHRLNIDQKEALVIVQRWVVDEKIDMTLLSSHTLHPTLTLLRYLRANGFDPNMAITHMTSNIKWRSEMKVDELVMMTPEDIMGCSMDSITRVFPHWHCGSDLTGRPVLYKQYGKFDVSKLKQITSMEAVMKYHIWEQEACLKLCIDQSIEKGVIIETCSAVLDVQDMKLSQVTREFLTLVKGIAAIDKDQYPETLGKLFIINVPSVFPLVWRSVQFFLDPATAAKIQIFGAKKDWLPALTAQIGLENMPSTYGGHLPPLNAEVHPYAQSMKQYTSSKADKGMERVGAIDLEEGLAEDSDTFIAAVDETGDEIDMYIRRGQIAAAELRRQGLSMSPPPPDGWNILSIKKMIVSTFSPPKSVSREPLSATSVSDTDSFSVRASPPHHPIHSEEGGNCSAKSVESRRAVGEGWETEFKYAHDLESSTELRSQKTPNHSSSPNSLPSIDKKLATSNGKVQVPLIARTYSFLLAIFHFLTFEKWVSKRSLKQIRKYLFNAVSAYMLAALTAMISSAYLVSATLWTSSIALYAHLWTGVVVLLISVVMMAINLAAFIGCYYQNRALLIMYAGILGSGAFMFAVVAISSFVYSTLPASGLGSDLYATFKDKNSYASKTVREYDLGLGGGCTMGAILAVIPLRLTCTMVYRLGKVQEKKVHPRQLRAVLRVAQCISLCAALVMLSFGGASLRYLFRINFEPTVFPLFGLVYCGVTVLLTAITGLWVAATAHKDIVFYYYIYLLPMLTVLLLAASGVSLSKIADAGMDVSEQFDTLYLPSSGKGSTVDDVQVAVDTQLLVAGVLCVFVCLFQIVSLVASRSLYRAMEKQEREGDSWLGCGEGGRLTMQRLRERDALLNGLAANNFSKQNVLGKLNFQNKREPTEKYVIFWAVVMALYHIYYHGTFVIFSSILDLDERFGKDFWLHRVWQELGKADNRYINSDAYFDCMQGILALAVGPLLLFFAWATYVRAPHRHLSGIISSSLMVYTEVLYFSVETRPRENNFQFQSNPGGTTAYIVCEIFFGVLLPLLVLWRELRSSVKGTSRADTQQLLLLMNTNTGTGRDRSGDRDRGGGSKGSESRHHTVESRYTASHSYGTGGVGAPRSSNATSIASVRMRHQSTSNFSDTQPQNQNQNQSQVQYHTYNQGLGPGLGPGQGPGLSQQGDRGRITGSTSRVSFDHGVRESEDEDEDDLESAVESNVFSQGYSKYQNSTTHTTRQHTPSSTGYSTPRDGERKDRPLESILRQSPPSVLYREKPLLSDHDAPLPGSADQYCEPEERKANDGSKSSEKVLTDTHTKDRDRDRDRDREGGSNTSSYTGSIASLSDAKAPSRVSERSDLSVSALLKLQLRSRPIDISRGRRGGLSGRVGGGGSRPHSGISRQSSEKGEERSDGGRERKREREREIVYQTRHSSSQPSTSTGSSSTPTPRLDFNANRPQNMGTMGGTWSTSGISSVSPEALLTALTMSMDRNASSLAMVV